MDTKLHRTGYYVFVNSEINLTAPEMVLEGAVAVAPHPLRADGRGPGGLVGHAAHFHAKIKVKGPKMRPQHHHPAFQGSIEHKNTGNKIGRRKDAAAQHVLGRGEGTGRSKWTERFGRQVGFVVVEPPTGGAGILALAANFVIDFGGGVGIEAGAVLLQARRRGYASRRI